MKLFCLSFAGGTASFFDQVEKSLGSEIDVIKLEYAGHGERRKEGFYNSFRELALDQIRAIKENITNNEEYALFGYSMGCISIMAILQEINNCNDINAPKYIFIAAHEPNTIKGPAINQDESLDEIIKRRTIQLGGVPQTLINNSSFWRMYLPVLRADYGLIIKYDFDALEYKSEIPVSILYSEEDTPLKEMQKWQKYFLGNVDYYKFSGSHFFIKDNYQEFANIINEKLRRIDYDI